MNHNHPDILTPVTATLHGALPKREYHIQDMQKERAILARRPAFHAALLAGDRAEVERIRAANRATLGIVWHE